MFQLLGVGPVRIAKTRFRREEEKIEERRPFPRSFPSLIFPCGNSSSGTFQVFVSAPFIVSIVSSIIRLWEDAGRWAIIPYI